MRHHLGGRTFGHEFAEIHGEDAVDQGRDALDVVIDEQHRLALGPERGDERGEVLDLAGREPREGLVDQHDLRVARDGLGEFEPAKIREGQRRRPAVVDGRKADTGRDFPGAAVDGGVGDQFQERVRQERELDVLADGLAMERARVLEDEAHTVPGDPVGRPAGYVDAVDQDLAGIGLHDAHDELHHGRLAGAVRPDQAEDLARADRQPHLVDRDKAAEALAQSRDLEERRRRGGRGQRLGTDGSERHAAPRR